MTLGSFIDALSVPKIIQTAKGTVSYLDIGQGPPLLALHGAMGGYDQSAILGRLVGGENFRIIAPSRPGFPGTSNAKDGRPETQAEHMWALLDALGIRTCPIVAISGGGPCAIHMALSQPERVEALILISTVSQPNPIKIPGRFTVLKLLAHVPGMARLLGRSSAKKVRMMIERAFPDPVIRDRVSHDPETVALLGAMQSHMFRGFKQRVLESENDFAVTQTTAFPLEAIAVPTLIVHGTDDPHVSFERHAVSAQKRLGHAQLLTLEGGGHMAIFAHRQAVQTACKAFLKTGNAPASCP